jgi:hypothetical protein
MYGPVIRKSSRPNLFTRSHISDRPRLQITGRGLGTDLCEFDGRFFIRGVLYIPLLERDEHFGWGIWAEIDRADFIRYLKLFNVDASNEAPINGALANAIPGYRDALNERLLVKFGNSSNRPEFHLDPLSKSTLAKDQHTGIDDKRYHDMLVTAGAI